MKRFTILTVSVVFSALFAVSTFAQAGAVPAAAKIGWLDTGAFADEKEGVTKYIAGLKALDLEMKPKITDLQTIQARLKTISDDLPRPKTRRQTSRSIRKPFRRNRTRAKSCSVILTTRKRNMTPRSRRAAARFWDRSRPIFQNRSRITLSSKGTQSFST